MPEGMEKRPRRSLVRNLVVLSFLLILSLLLWDPVPPGLAADRTYYDADGNPISAEAYQEMRQRRRRCLETTTDHYQFTRCMEQGPVPVDGPATPSPRPRPERTPPPPPVPAPGPDKRPVDGTRHTPKRMPPPAPVVQEDTDPAPPERPAVSIPEPERAGAPAPPATAETSPPRKMDNPVIHGQREQPVRVIEREISVPGGGVLKVKEYQYE
jgi:hypothetical protein